MSISDSSSGNDSVAGAVRGETVPVAVQWGNEPWRRVRRQVDDAEADDLLNVSFTFCR